MSLNRSEGPQIGSSQIGLLEELCNACSISGNEREVREIVRREIESYTNDLRTDTMGNLLATVQGKGKTRLKVMLAAHMDEVGFMLTDKGEQGYFRFATVGGVKPTHIAGKRVWIGSDHIPGVIGVNPIHLSSSEQIGETPDIDALRIDVGPEHKNSVKPGDQAVFATAFARLESSLRAKAMDDRVGVATLIELVKHAPPNVDLLAAFTVQEEVGLRGAGVAAYSLEPDLAFVLDCTPAYDFPNDNNEENVRYNTRLGHGPAIYIADRATLADPRLVRHLIHTAEKENLPYQLRQPGGGGTDAGTIHKQRRGIPSVSVSVPGRYLHTPASIIRLSDWKNSLDLIYKALVQLPKNILAGERN